jgi:hypothetical protein
VKDEAYVPPMPLTLNNLNYQIQTAIAKIDQPLLQNIWHEVKYCLDVCRATNGAQTEHSQGMKNFLSCSLQWCEFNFCVPITYQ